MLENRDDFNSQFNLKLDNNPQITGLDAFKRKLEKAYFSNISVRNCITEENRGNLVIELDCHFELADIIHHLKKDYWGQIEKEIRATTGIPPLKKALSDLETLNELEIDIEEFSIFLNDVAIIIKKTYRDSIQEQLCHILKAIAQHHPYFTRNFSETPYEIYIPVFEEDILENEHRYTKAESPEHTARDYFKYWGIYFDTEEDAVIYDLKRKRIITGDLYMLNH